MEGGTDYVAEHAQKEENDFLELVKHRDKCDQKGFQVVSQDTVSTQQENNRETMKIYKTYDFVYRPKANLTITSVKDQIVSMIETNSVVVIQGPTGCGKTTQVPQFILDSCCKKRLHCNIIVTQPRRIAAISIAKRVSEERNWPVGTLVGYQVGLINNTCPDTRLNYCTTGVLLHKLINSKHMLDYTHIIIDEVHERDQNMDFLLLLVRMLLRRNSSSVKVILMSATFKVERFATYFSSPVGNKLTPAPIIDIEKRNRFNVTICYLCQMGALGLLPEVSATEPNVSKQMMEFCVNLTKVLDDVDANDDDADCNLERNVYERHAILVFLPGMDEIEEMHNFLSLPKHDESKWDIVVLHSSITNNEQQRIFIKPPHGYRRIILSTNIAESSITVPDIKYVIDFCLTKQLIIDGKTNFQSLELTWASKVNCEQRAGRTGRVMHGRVYRLVSQTFYESVLPREAPPEMLRAPLTNLVLKAKLLDMGEPKAILALSLDPPDLDSLERTILLLKEAGALTNKTNKIQNLDGELTDLGRVMANLPVDIYLTKLIMLGHVFSVLKDTIIMAASLAVKDVFNSPFRQKLLSFNVRLKWASGSCSDCIAFMHVYKAWITEKANRRITNNAAEQKWAMRNFVQIKVLREVKVLVSELTRRLEKFGIQESVGVNKVIWKETERPFVLKIAIAGAFYPNYYVKHVPEVEMNEHAAVKLLGGLDPSKTVYLRGWPLKQPGILYARKIQDMFRKNGISPVEKIRVSFDASSRVYIQFAKDKISGNESNDTSKQISPSVYEAIRMRECKIPLDIPILNEAVAIQRAKEINFERKSFFTCEDSRKDSMKPRLPGLRVSRILAVVYNVINPGHFWIQMRDSNVKREMDRIQSTIEETKHRLNRFVTAPKIGSLVIAPYEQNNCKSYFRAVVEGHKTSSETLVQVFFIDYGYAGECRLCDLRCLDSDSEIANIPALAFQCILANVQPSIAYNLCDSWSGAAYDFFWTLINKPGVLIGEIYSIVNGVIALELIHKSKEGGEEISINQCLIDKRFAIRKEENYFSRFNHNLRSQQSEISDEQCRHYEQLQNDQGCMSDIYPEPTDSSECCATINLRGPFSPLEIELKHLTVIGSCKKVHTAVNSVNSVLLDTDPEDSHQRLLVAGSVLQNVHTSNLTLYNTTLMPRLPGLTALITLIFTPCTELRRDTFGSCYVGALCGLGSDPITNGSIFPEHDIELHFDTEVTIDDLQYINRLRYWMSIGMQINNQSKSSDNMEEIIICQNRVKDALLKLIEKPRNSQIPELIYNFDKWNLYDESLYLEPSRQSVIANNIYRLHNALELEETTALQEITEHLRTLRALTVEGNRKTGNSNICCKLCKVTLSDIFDLRGHLFTIQHRENEKQLGIEL
ncbi:probable ATP-dependent RNA helicase spindle-E isoform X1 [Colletes gigas]|uniref:probable ATP-dependent RNA helicase spindle-E isoform X1 n=1 Tax=Colletes gigas TaxID=935657 RepID=UPI001C9A856F|nr:probable ATP-dependent RNA helicase spindle-E isoform X1 [Colletes gigas]XP_043254814.1 probable ATP-dependent RNA helicase spindle-E isoform X1 [Colletes gigas]XP_043254815.1 probable ATP-dependent RNA helicase spindle-E isoform X1 [Colletes gigas]